MPFSPETQRDYLLYLIGELYVDKALLQDLVDKTEDDNLKLMGELHEARQAASEDGREDSDPDGRNGASVVIEFPGQLRLEQGTN